MPTNTQLPLSCGLYWIRERDWFAPFDQLNEGRLLYREILDETTGGRWPLDGLPHWPARPLNPKLQVLVRDPETGEITRLPRERIEAMEPVPVWGQACGQN